MSSFAPRFPALPHPCWWLRLCCTSCHFWWVACAGGYCSDTLTGLSHFVRCGQAITWGYSLTTFFPLSLVVIWPVLPTSELNQLSHTIAHRLARYLERQGLLERDAEHGTLSLNHSDEDPMDQLRGHSITYRIVVGPQQGRKVYTLQTLPGVEEAFRPRACS